MDASTLRRKLYAVLKHLPEEGPIEVSRNGRVAAMLSLPPSEMRTQSLRVDTRRLARICKRQHIRRLALFGSVARGDFMPDSDVDILIDLETGKKKTFESHMATCDALSDLFGREVDLHYFDAFEACPNKYLKVSIAEDLHVLYEA